MKYVDAFKTSRAANAAKSHKTKSRHDLICSLRKEVAAWKARALGKERDRAPKPIIDEAARKKREEERAAARAWYDSYVLSKEAIKPKKDLALEKWEEDRKQRGRE
jgi:hypothetical protein